jgi:hypothetical protein
LNACSVLPTQKAATLLWLPKSIDIELAALWSSIATE